MTRWPNCHKIHEGCGGIVRWVEAIDRPAVGYHGECLECGDTEIPVEAIVPVEGVELDVLRDADRKSLADVRWDSGTDWEENQERLERKVRALVA